MLKKVQKTLVLLSIITVGIVVGMLILALILTMVDKPSFGNFYFRSIILSFAVICAACFFANNALDVIKKTKILSICALSLLVVGSLLGLIEFWSDFEIGGFFGKFIGIVAITACFFTMIVTTNGKLGDKYKAIKIIYFVCIVIVDIALILEILQIVFGYKNDDPERPRYILDYIGFPFAIACLVVFAFMCVTNILGKRLKIDENNDLIDNSAKEKKTLEEQIATLNLENEELKKENEALKAEIEKLKAEKIVD